MNITNNNKVRTNIYLEMMILLFGLFHPEDVDGQFNTLGGLAGKTSETTPSANSGTIIKGEQILAILEKIDDDSSQMPRLHAPLQSLIVTSRAGWRTHPLTGKWTFHQGIDLRAFFEQVYAVMAGVVGKVGYDERYGIFIRLIHSPQITSSYAHLSETKVKEGETVQAGQVIGISGNTGNSTGPHLHFQFAKNR